jgi:mannitol/fructose-specific phosphotransferase system IIA component (Ntr-type)
MDLGDILSPEQINPALQATNRWEAIDELIGNLVACQKIKPEHREAITAVVKKRESTMSTGIGFGIGIPHASTDLIYEVTGAFGRSRKGINFDALDNKPVSLVMLFLVPQGQFQKHLHTLAKIAKLLHKREFRQSLEEAPDSKAMFEFIKAGASDGQRRHDVIGCDGAGADRYRSAHAIAISIADDARAGFIIAGDIVQDVEA